MQTIRLRIAVAAALAVLAAVALAGCGSSQAAAGDTKVEIMAPSAFSVADFAGKPLVVNFFGSWCGPCNIEAPDLSNFSKANPDVQFVGIAVDDTEADATGFMTKYDLQYPLVLDDRSLGDQYGITGVPTTIFFDAQGQEKDRIVGAATSDQFTASLAKAQ